MNNTEKNNILELVARNKLDIETLETRNSDRLDFHDISVWKLKEALETAFTIGREMGIKIQKDVDANDADSEKRSSKSLHLRY